jgi:uncharacterized protein YqeY
MTLKEQITSDMLVARKSGNTIQKNVLSVLITELEKIEKLELKFRAKGEVTDTEIKVVIKKLVDSNVECNNEEENVYLNCYLPSTLSENELLTIIISEVNANGYNSLKDMGKVMSYLSTNYTGQYDGKIASNFVKSTLNA